MNSNHYEVSSEPASQRYAIVLNATYGDIIAIEPMDRYLSY